MLLDVFKAAVTLLCSFLAYHVFLALSTRFVARGRPVPSPANEHWLTGHIFPLVADEIKQGAHIDTVYKKLRDALHSRLIRLNLGLNDNVSVMDADAVKEVLVTHNYPKSPTYSGLIPFLGHSSMIVLPEALWKKQRTSFNKGFQYSFLKDMVPTFVEKGNQFVAMLLTRISRKEVDLVVIHSELSKLTMEIITKVVLSEDCSLISPDEADGSNLMTRVHVLFLELLDLTAFYLSRPDQIWTKYLPWVRIKINRTQRELDNLLLTIIKKRINQIKSLSGSESPRDILSLAIEANSEDGKSKLRLQDILSQVKTFLFAGHDTTATNISFCIYELSRNPDIEKRLVDEIREVCGDLKSISPTADQLNQMKLLNAIIKESLRLWPPGGSARIAPPGSTLQGYDVGAKVLYCGHTPMHTDPFYWGPDAGVFRPDRWLDVDYVAKLHPFCYTPFSKGPRDCIGQVFALLEGKALLCLLYSKFSFKYGGKGDEELIYKITSVPKFGVPVHVTRRSID